MYAFEPSVAAGELLRRNLAANGVDDAVHFFNAGLATHTHRETTGDETLNFVDGVPFVIANLPTSVDLLKMDCEGCEYPMFEDKRFAEGTNAIGKAVVEATEKNGAKSIIGGGDSVKALNEAGLGNRVTFMSTGGGASLEFLEGKELPGVAALSRK